MRHLALGLIAALSMGAAALAAPTCDDAIGRTVRCGTPGAMPVGWTPPPEAQAPPDPAATATPTELFGLICFIGGLLTLFRVLPDFEGENGDGWDVEEDQR